MCNLVRGAGAALGAVRATGVNTEGWMTDEQIEQAVRKVVGTDASPRTVQPLVEAVKRFGLGWLETYQQRQPATRQQRTSRQRITLDWADVEAWVKRQPHTSKNWVVDGYYTDCPVSTHKTDDLISVWSGDDGGIGLKCWGGCRYGDIHDALADIINSTPKPDLETLVKELTAEKADLAKQLTATKHDRVAAENRVRELEIKQSHLEKIIISTEEERKRESAARIAAQNQVRRIQAVKPGTELENRLAAVEEERDRERTARTEAENRIRELEEEQSRRRADREQGENGPLADAWRLFSKEEPTYAFIDGMVVLEYDLRQALKHRYGQDYGQDGEDGLHNMLYDASGIGWVREEQRRDLSHMNWKRNRVMHDRHPVEEQDARVYLKQVEQVIGQLDS